MYMFGGNLLIPEIQQTAPHKMIKSHLISVVACQRLSYLCSISRTYACIEYVTFINIVYYIKVYMFMLDKISESKSVQLVDQ